MKKIMDILKFSGPIIFAGVIAITQAIAGQLDQRRIDTMEDRIEKLESKREGS